MKIVLSSIWYPMSISRYFEAALKRREDVELFTVGPYTGQWIPWGGGMNLPLKYAKAPDLSLGNTISNFAPVEYIERQLPWTPDLWLQIDAGFYLRGKPRNGLNFVVGTDPHVLNYDLQRGYADKFFCMQTPYADPDDEYLPYGFDPIWHKPEPQEQRFDVCLIGLHYQQRNDLVSALMAQGLKVYYDLGPAFDEARRLYNQAPVGLNWSSRQDLTARVFELLGMGRIAVVNRVPDLDKFFEDGRDLLVFENQAEAIERVIFGLDNGEIIARQGYETVQPHTWDARIEQILGVANEL